MKFSRLLTNGLIIFIGIGLYFLLIEALGLKDQIYLRLVNFIFVIYGVNRTIKANARLEVQGVTLANSGLALPQTSSDKVPRRWASLSRRKTSHSPGFLPRKENFPKETGFPL